LATAQVDVRIQVESHEFAGWHPRDRKDFEALLEQEMAKAFDLSYGQGTDWGAHLTRSGDTGLESELGRLLQLLRKHALRDVRVAVIHNRRWAFDPFGPLTAEVADARPAFASDGRLFGVEADEVYLVVEVRSRELPARPDSEDLIQALARFAAPGFNVVGGSGDRCLALLGSEDDVGLGSQLVRIAAFLRSRGFPPDTRLDVAIERSWWVEVSSPGGRVGPGAGEGTVNGEVFGPWGRAGPATEA
jgi:hypothetical protein